MQDLPQPDPLHPHAAGSGLNPHLQEALRLAALGFRVFPCKADKVEPLLGSSFLKEATSDPQLIQRWWRTCPKANIGVVTDGLVVLDCQHDPETGRTNPWLLQDGERLEHLQSAATIATPQADYLYIFRQPFGHDYVGSRHRLAPHVHVHAKGSHILVPPSVVNGQHYTWYCDNPLSIRRDYVPIPPPWLIAALDQAIEPAATPLSTTLSSKLISLPTPALTTPALRPTAATAATAAIGTTATTATAVSSRPLDHGQTQRPTANSPRHPDVPPQRIAAAPSPRIDTPHETPRMHTPLDIANHALSGNGLSDALGLTKWELKLTCLADVQPELLKWLWPYRIPLGKLTLLGGDPGMSKSILSIFLTAQTTRGAGWPDCPDHRSTPGRVLLMNCEDGVGDTILPRAIAAGADPKLVHVVEGVQQRDSPAQSGRFFNLQRDILALRAALEKYPDTRLVIIDPISAYCGEVDTHNNAEVRAMLAPLAELAAKYNVAVVMVTHLAKGGSPKAVYRSMGSLAFAAAARGVHAVASHPEDPDVRLFLPIKFNLGPMPKGLAYHITETGSIEWHKDLVDFTADELLGEGRSARRSESLGRNSAAENFLKICLAEGPKLASEIYAEGEELDFSVTQLKRAKARIGVTAYKESSKTGRWLWRLPTDPDTSNPQAPEDFEDPPF